jgi:hypothetical protein
MELYTRAMLVPNFSATGPIQNQLTLVKDETHTVGAISVKIACVQVNVMEIELHDAKLSKVENICEKDIEHLIVKMLCDTPSTRDLPAKKKGIFTSKTNHEWPLLGPVQFVGNLTEFLKSGVTFQLDAKHGFIVSTDTKIALGGLPLNSVLPYTPDGVKVSIPLDGAPFNNVSKCILTGTLRFANFFSFIQLDAGVNTVGPIVDAARNPFVTTNFKNLLHQPSKEVRAKAVPISDSTKGARSPSTGSSVALPPPLPSSSLPIARTTGSLDSLLSRVAVSDIHVFAHEPTYFGVTREIEILLAHAQTGDMILFHSDPDAERGFNVVKRSVMREFLKSSANHISMIVRAGSALFSCEMLPNNQHVDLDSLDSSVTRSYGGCRIIPLTTRIAMFQGDVEWIRLRSPVEAHTADLLKDEIHRIHVLNPSYDNFGFVGAAAERIKGLRDIVVVKEHSDKFFCSAFCAYLLEYGNILPDKLINYSLVDPMDVANLPVVEGRIAVKDQGVRAKSTDL